jgi:hypothetical protein
MAKRTVIDAYIIEAFRGLSNSDDYLAVFAEHPVKETKISASLAVHGSVDYVFANVPGASRNNELKRGDAVAQIPNFCVIEAKRTIGVDDGKFLLCFLTCQAFLKHLLK